MKNQNKLRDEIEEIYKQYRLNDIKEYAYTNFKKEFLSYTKDKDIIVREIYNKKKANDDEMLSCIYQVATIIDSCYSTQVRNFNNIYYICDHIYATEKIFKDLTGDINKKTLIASLDELIKALYDDERIKKIPFSFITKYFALHRKRYDKNLEPLPIYDKYVQMYLDCYYKNKEKTFVKGKYNYKNFYKDMEKIASELNIDFDELDNKIWFTAKSLQFLIGSTSDNDSIKETLNKYLNNTKDYESCQDRYFIELIKKFSQ